MQPQVMNGAAGIRLKSQAAQREVFEDKRDKEMHYIFWAGDKPIPLADHKVGMVRIDPMVITAIDNYGYWDRDQSDTSTGLRRHPTRKDEVWMTKTAGSIVEWLERCWGDKGLVVLRCLTGIEPELVITIASSLIPQIPNTYQELSGIVEQNRDEIYHENIIDLQNEVADLILNAIDIASQSGTDLLASIKGEMEDRRVPGGRGISKLDNRARRLIKLLGKSEADYETDTRAAGNAAAEQVARVLAKVQPQQGGQSTQVDPIVLAQAMALALQQVGFGPTLNNTPAADPTTLATTPTATVPPTTTPAQTTARPATTPVNNQNKPTNNKPEAK